MCNLLTHTVNKVITTVKGVKLVLRVGGSRAKKNLALIMDKTQEYIQYITDMQYSYGIKIL